MPSPSAATQLCEDTDATAQEGQPSENGSENRGRAGLGRPVPCLTFAFIGKKKNSSRKSGGRTQTSASLLRGRAALSYPIFAPSPCHPLLAPLLRALLQRGFAPSRRPRKGAAQAFGHRKPSPSPAFTTPFFAADARHPARGKSSGTRRGCRCRVSAACHRWCSWLLPSKALAAEPPASGEGDGRGRNAGDGAGSSGLDVLGDALGQGGPCSRGKRFPSNSPNLGGLRVKITNERFIDTRAVGRRKQTAIHPARVPSARHAIDKNSERGSVRFMGRARKTRHCPPGSRNAAFEAGDGDGRPPAPRPRPHNAPLFGAGRV